MIITALDIKQWVEKDKVNLKELLKLPIKCRNCGFRDLLGKTLIKTDSIWSYNMEGKIITINGERYKKYLECPKCGSSLIEIEKENLPEYIVRII